VPSFVVILLSIISQPLDFPLENISASLLPWWFIWGLFHALAQDGHEHQVLPVGTTHSPGDGQPVSHGQPTQPMSVDVSTFSSFFLLFFFLLLFSPSVGDGTQDLPNTQCWYFYSRLRALELIE
jgi:hypothetical protein